MAKAEQFTYRPCHDMIKTQIINCSKSCRNCIVELQCGLNLFPNLVATHDILVTTQTGLSGQVPNPVRSWATRNHCSHCGLLVPNIQNSATELFCHILNRAYPAPLRTYELHIPLAPDKEVVVEIMVDLYKSIRSTGLRYIIHWLLTYLVYDSSFFEMS
jgi:hypothetical protein